MTHWRFIAATAAALAVSAGASTRDHRAFTLDVSPFSVVANGETSSARERSVFVLPRAAVSIEAADGPEGAYAFHADQGRFVSSASHAWRWTAPAEPGLYDLSIDGPGHDGRVRIHAFVMTPADGVHDGALNGYRLGDYPSKPLNGNPIYLPPAGFIEVTKKNAATKVSPHFTLGQFVCKQDPVDQYPKYVVLQERLLLKLETVLELVNDLGFHADTLHVMSAYRTPYYNHAIGDVLYSEHQFGSAADVYVDPGDNGRMDDLNGDGRVNIDDSKFLYDRIDDLLSRKPFAWLQGGMGYYAATAAHPPFVHVDVRGTRARWKG